MTTTTPTAASTILAIDLGKYKSVSCLYTGSPEYPCAPSFGVGQPAAFLLA